MLHAEVSSSACNKLGGSGSEVERVRQVKLPGVVLTNDFKWQGHIDSVCRKESSRFHFLKMLRRAGVDPKDIVAIYVALIRSIFEYACQVWNAGLTVQQSDQLELVQRSAPRVAYPGNPDLSYRAALQTTGLDTLRDRRDRLYRAFFAKGCSRNYPRGGAFFFQTPPPPEHTWSQSPPTPMKRKCFN